MYGIKLSAKTKEVMTYILHSLAGWLTQVESEEVWD